MGQTKKSTAFSAEIELAPTPSQNLEVNNLLLQAIVVACTNNEDFKNEVLNSLNNLQQ